MNLEILKNLVLYNPVNKKIRLGRQMDGGYVIVDGYNYDYFISAGVGSNISFEIDFLNRCDNIYGVIFDGTVNEPKHLPKQLKFIRKNIGINNDEYTTDLKEYVNSRKDIFIKMDIEGYEWDWLLSFSELFPKIKQLVFEGHRFFNNIYNTKILKSLQTLNKTHYLVHVHENNNNEKLVNIQNLMYPCLLELTFIRKDCEINGFNTLDLPIFGLDFPNVKKIEHNMNMWPFVLK